MDIVRQEGGKENGARRYSGPDAGFDADTCAVIVAIDEQSPDIAQGTNDDVGGAGDQGMMFGYACNETPDLMPLPITLANQMAFQLSQKRKDGALPFILPDGKTQVTVEYSDDGKPIRIDTIVISTQHRDWVCAEDMQDPLLKHIIMPVLEKAKVYLPELDIDNFDLFVNPTGRFVKGGPAADTGLTGRKIIVDTYGGAAAHGGGAFSGKDPTKVDRSGAYMARYIAKNIVAGGICQKCQVQIAYAIGVAAPVSIRVDTFGEYPNEELLEEAVRRVFNFTPAGIMWKHALRHPIYKNTSAYGHFGTVIGEDRTWEHTDAAEDIAGVVKAMEEEAEQE